MTNSSERCSRWAFPFAAQLLMQHVEQHVEQRHVDPLVQMATVNCACQGEPGSAGGRSEAKRLLYHFSTGAPPKGVSKVTLQPLHCKDKHAYTVVTYRKEKPYSTGAHRKDTPALWGEVRGVLPEGAARPCGLHRREPHPDRQPARQA